MKNTTDGLAPKVRLVAIGFEEEGLQEIPKDSTTCLKESMYPYPCNCSTEMW